VHSVSAPTTRAGGRTVLVVVSPRGYSNNANTHVAGHGLLREGMVALLSENAIEVVAQAEDGPGLLRIVDGHEPDPAICDVRLPPGFTDEGIRGALEARRRHPELAVLVLSQDVEPAYSRELPSAGESGVGYLLTERISEVCTFRRGPGRNDHSVPHRRHFPKVWDPGSAMRRPRTHTPVRAVRCGTQRASEPPQAPNPGRRVGGSRLPHRTGRPALSSVATGAEGDLKAIFDG
jgi:CheY-like chemotaxis protein